MRDASGEMTLSKGVRNATYRAPRCSSCGMPVDEAGRCLVKKFNQWYASYHVHSHPDDYPSLAIYSWSTNGVDLHN